MTVSGLKPRVVSGYWVNDVPQLWYENYVWSIMRATMG